MAGKFEESENVFRRLLEITPDFWHRPYLAKTLLAQGKPKEALRVIEQAKDTDKIDLLPIMLFANDRASDAEAALQALIANHSTTKAYYIAMTYAYRQDKQQALTWFERAYAQKEPALLDMIGEPLLNNISSEARYRAILRAMNLPR